MYCKIDCTNVLEIVFLTYENVISDVEKKLFPLSSEKTLVVKFLLELAKLIDSQTLLYFDFEYKAFDHLGNTDKFLDLLFWTDENFKVAIEFKFPTKSVNKATAKISNSNQTETKKNIYRDIARLKYLVDNNINSINIGYFICATNETAYINKGASESKYRVDHGFQYQPNCDVPVIESFEYPSDFSFIWFEITESSDGRRGKYDKIGPYIWLTPIEVTK